MCRFSHCHHHFHCHYHYHHSKLIQLILLFLTQTEHGSDNHWCWNAFNSVWYKEKYSGGFKLCFLSGIFLLCFYLSVFFFLSPSSSSFILHFSGKNELAKIAALVVDQSENRTCLSITREPHAWAPRSTLLVRFLRDRGCLSFNSYPVSSLITCQNNACIILAWHGVLHGREFWKLFPSYLSYLTGKNIGSTLNSSRAVCK